jgi:hypothetical protein
VRESIEVGKETDMFPKGEKASSNIRKEESRRNGSTKATWCKSPRTWSTGTEPCQTAALPTSASAPTRKKAAATWFGPVTDEEYKEATK